MSRPYSLPVLQRALIECGVTPDRGQVLEAHLPSRHKFNAMLAAYAPGCGSEIRVAGTNGGFMRCGAELTELDGTTRKHFCHHCEQQQEPNG